MSSLWKDQSEKLEHLAQVLNTQSKTKDVQIGSDIVAGREENSKADQTPGKRRRTEIDSSNEDLNTTMIIKSQNTGWGATNKVNTNVVSVSFWFSHR